MTRYIKQILIITLAATIVSFSINLVSPNGISFVGFWPSIDDDESNMEFPPEEEGDPPFIKMSQAFSFYKSNDILFIDSRDPEDYELAHIPGAINMAYDYIEEEYWENPPEVLREYNGYVVYCSGSECELSLLLGRDLMYRGYENVYVFFGGWRQWEKAELPIDTGTIGEGN